MINTEIDIIDDRKTLGARSSIAERLAALQRNGELEWKKRLSRLAPPENDFSSITSVTETQEVLRKELMGVLNNSANRLNIDRNKDESLADRLGKLENATQGWKKRVEPSDAVQFSVAGKMAGNLSVLPPLASPAASDKKKRVPCPVRFKSRNYDNQQSEIRSSPTSPEKSFNSSVTYNRCSSLPNGMTEDTENVDGADHRIVNVPQIFDDNFSTFFGNVSQTLLKSSSSVSVDKAFDIDLEKIKTNTPSPLACRKNVVKVQRRHASSSVNPIKALASKGITKQEYSEIKTDIAERELKRINVEKLSKNSSLAVEVLAGLASKEDFTSVPLKKAGSSIIKSMLPYKPLMLIHVKGRRHVQSRLVEPTFKAINSGDSYILVTSNELYHWTGSLSNVIERSRSAEIVQHILTTHDLGCSADNVYTILESPFNAINSRQEQKFWIHLGVSENEAASIKAAGAGHPDEDELFESSLISTNMIYEALEEELVPVEKFWGTIPKIEMLDPNKVLIFDFGAEMYIWMGKNVDLKRRKSSIHLAKELWDNGYNYTECDTCPITACLMVGNREDVSEDLNDKRNSNERPSWCLQAKITQHMETILFREKFLDWPDFTRVIRAKGKDEDTEKQIDPSVNVKPCDVKEMLDYKPTEPDLQLEGNHLGRGVQYYDNELRRYYSITTLDVCVWHIAEYDSKELNKESFGQFHSGDSYVIRWLYSITFTGRELSGLPSRHSVVGRDRCVYFCWQGRDASLNEQGAAALLTVELDKEKGPQVRISQGYEPAAFCGLFNGQMVIYKNKRDRPSGKKWRLYICRGEIESEAMLVEVSANIRQLRSRASLVLVNTEKNAIYVWHGVKSPNTVRKICMTTITNLIDSAPPEFSLDSKLKTTVTEIMEGEEPSEFFEGVNNNSRKLYLSLLNEKDQYDKTPLLFHLTSAAGLLNAVPVQYPYYHQNRVSPYPFSQNDLYSVRQPALFLLDNGNELWLWQGWWPEQEKNRSANNSEEEADSTTIVNNHRGSAAIRWQAERRASMQTALDYWEKSRGKDELVKAYLVWAGLEPLQFTNLFPDWDDRDDIAEINIKDGRKPGEILPVDQELARLTQSTYPLEQLLQRPLPDGVDPTKLEIYLAPQYFQELLKTTKEEFLSLPSWKQSNMKKAVGLF